MKEKGKIIEIKGDIAVVLMEEKGRCKSCGLCKKIMPGQPTIEAENLIKADIGDNVEVEINEEDLFKISLFIYGIPLLGFILGVGFSYFLKNVFLKVIIFLFFLTLFWTSGFKKSKIYGQETKPKVVSKI